MPLTAPQKLWQWLATRLHVLVLLPTVLVLGSSPFLLMGRRLRENASVWDFTHVYLGLLLVPLSILLFCYCLSGGRAKQFFPLFEPSGLISDLKGLIKGKLPKGGGNGLFSLLEGICALLLVATAVTGLGWFLTEGSSEALVWRGWHKDLGLAFFIALIAHLLAAVSHLLDFFRN